MKKIQIFILAVVTFCLASCSNSPSDKAQSSVKAYLKDNLKNYSSYEPISFLSLDTFKQADTSETKQISVYKITHIYSIINSEKDKAKMTVSFFLDKDFKVNKSNTTSINGDYGSLTGNAYWKYNNYVGNKADAGSEITLYSLDKIRGDLKFEVTTDVQGNYKIDKILPGNYLLIVRSENATDCPDSHLSNLRIYKEDIKQLFGFDIDKYKNQLKELDELDSIYLKSSDEFPSNGTFSQMTSNMDKTKAILKQRTEKIEKLFDSFPEEFKRKIKLYTGYSNAFDFTTIQIEEGKTKNVITDFGITCI